MKIFIVEDSPAVLERLVEIVSDVAEVNVVGDATSYPAAVSGILETRPDVAILDVKLADDRGSGIDVLERVRRDVPGMRAIVLSNYVTPQHLKASTEAGAEYFLDKSADTDRIPGILLQMKKELDAG
jgi:DNA-binding NarL/FixJ family response regulator